MNIIKQTETVNLQYIQIHWHAHLGLCCCITKQRFLEYSSRVYGFPHLMCVNVCWQAHIWPFDIWVTSDHLNPVSFLSVTVYTVPKSPPPQCSPEMRLVGFGLIWCTLYHGRWVCCCCLPVVAISSPGKAGTCSGLVPAFCVSNTHVQGYMQ